MFLEGTAGWEIASRETLAHDWRPKSTAILRVPYSNLDPGGRTQRSFGTSCARPLSGHATATTSRSIPRRRSIRSQKLRAGILALLGMQFCPWATFQIKPGRSQALLALSTYENRLQKNIGHPYSNLFTGGPGLSTWVFQPQCRFR